MKQLLLLCVLVGSLSAQDEKKASWLPLAKGAKWTYKTDQEVDMIYEITGKEKVGDVECFVVEHRTGEDRVMRKEWLAVDAGGVKVHQGQRGKTTKLSVEKPYLKLKTPFEKGATWTGESKTGDGAVITYTAEVIGEEEIEVPAGKYKAWKLSTTAKSEAGGVTGTEWYAPDVGMVRAEFDFNFGGSGTAVVYELKEFKKGE